MNKDDNNKVEFTSFHDMMTAANKEKIKESEKIEISKLKPFPDHKFKPYTDERFTDMVESIEEFGVISPIIVWEKDNEYIILSGHNRVAASKALGLKEIPCVVKKNLTIEEATLIVTETNLMQRSFTDLSHSERAYVLEQHYSTLKKQGKRNDLFQNIETETALSIDIVGDNYNLSKNKVAKYIRLAKLPEFLLNKVDNNQLSFIAAYNISFIENNEIQEKINYFIEKGINISVEKADELKRLFNENKLNINNIEQILLYKENKNIIYSNKTKKQIRISESILTILSQNLEDYDDMSNKQIINTIAEAVEFYFKKNKRR